MHPISPSPSMASIPSARGPTGNPVLAPTRAVVAALVKMDSRLLFGAAQEVRIDHNGQEYRLRQTRNGKLILTK
jgi:hemin uptake protein HemP